MPSLLHILQTGPVYLDNFSSYTLLLFGGLHPLWGIGVTSFMRWIFKPALWIARSAASRPAPGPFIYTSTVLMPCSIAFFAAFSAASCAAKGVLFLEPLK